MNLFIALAPVVKIDNMSSGFIKTLSDNENIEKSLIKMNVNEMFPSDKNRKAAAFFQKLIPELTSYGIKLIADDNPELINEKGLDGFVAHFPTGTSLRSI